MISERGLCLSSLGFFAYFVSKQRWKPARHLLHICEILEMILREQKKLMIMMPPRHGKSELIAYYFPVWYLCNKPSHRVIYISYEASLAEWYGRRVRDLFRIWAEPLAGLKLNESSGASNRWDIANYEGGYSAVGVGGPITGKGANLLIIDDPIKNSEQAMSKTYRDKLWDWYQSVVVPRLEPAGSRVIVQTRWHVDDLVGRILKEEKGWQVVKLPAIALPNDPLGREEGEPLWKERFSLQQLEEIRNSIGTFWWSALYQQEPVQEEGAIIKKSWIQFYDSLPSLDSVIMSWDTAFKDQPTSSYVVGQVWGKRENRYYLIAQRRGRWTFLETLEIIREMLLEYPNIQKIYIEESANGVAIIEVLKKKFPYLIEPVRMRESKEARLMAVSPLWETGRVYLPREPWIDTFLSEVLSFPHSEFSDQVDAMSQALLMLSQRERVLDFLSLQKSSLWR